MIFSLVGLLVWEMIKYQQNIYWEMNQKGWELEQSILVMKICQIGII